MSELTGPERDLAARLRGLTPARVGLGRIGVSQETRDQLEFQRAHSQARDAVHARLECEALAAMLGKISSGEVMRLHSAAPDRATYLQRPDLGRRLEEASRKVLTRAFEPGGWELAPIVADGLSALAVAIGDEIGLVLGAEISVVLIGERPGLSSPDSLGVYITWAPRPGRTDAERNCVSNIRAEGLSYAQAAAQLVDTVTEARRLRLTGVALKIETRTSEKAIEKG